MWKSGFLIAVLAVAGCSRDSLPIDARLKNLFHDAELTPDEVRQALGRELRTARTSDAVFPTQGTLLEFYGKQRQSFAWCDPSGKILDRAQLVLEALRRAGEHGLDPEDYAVGQLERLKQRIATASGDSAALLADFDILTTAAFFRYASDVSTGRVHPNEIRQDWHTNPPELDLVGALASAVESDRLPDLLDRLPPPHEGYRRLREALKALREVEAKGGWPAVPDGPKLERGSRGPRVVAMRQRLAAPAGPSDRYDAALAGAVASFQEVHGIEPDGKVGPATLAELNVPVDRRIREIELNLERWRWIPRDLGSPAVVVNIPGFELELVRKGAPSWRTRIVVGKAYTPTPVFSDRIVGVLVNPPWNVPESIAVGEYLPELREDSRALERQGLRLLEGSGDKAREVDPASVDWSRVDEGHFPFRIRQDPGPENALGKLKFELTNEFHVYLHDTPAAHLFDRTDRGRSHGCIRVEHPLELAERILGEASREALSDALDQPEERRLPVKPPVSVHVLYWTAWVDEAGRLHFGPDLYEFDRAQMAALEGSRAEIAGIPRSG
ncbi:MAG TPA: L,D-transpeptidase family protein [Candidatus Polarisedimenticolaceae bacterium]|nr:L,D-transpeptidase family protein [Candidatus Polarisedimenticolaceae bacterium]